MTLGGKHDAVIQVHLAFGDHYVIIKQLWNFVTQIQTAQTPKPLTLGPHMPSFVATEHRWYL